MSIESQADLAGIKKISEIVGITLKQMRAFAQSGMTTKELDAYGYSLLKKAGARPAPKLAYGFPGWTCISLNHEVAHGIPSDRVIMQTGDLVNIDVSAELNGYYSDNGGSFVLGPDIHKLNPLVACSKRALFKAIQQIKGGVKIADIGGLIEAEAKKNGFKVIKNLLGHGIGRSLHEEPHEIACYYDKANKRRFRKNEVVAIETFISTKASYAQEKGDGWTLITKDGSFVAQHEHTILITDDSPVILTAANAIWDV